MNPSQKWLILIVFLDIINEQDDTLGSIGFLLKQSMMILMLLLRKEAWVQISIL